MILCFTKKMYQPDRWTLYLEPVDPWTVSNTVELYILEPVDPWTFSDTVARSLNSLSLNRLILELFQRIKYLYYPWSLEPIDPWTFLTDQIPLQDRWTLYPWTEWSLNFLADQIPLQDRWTLYPWTEWSLNFFSRSNTAPRSLNSVSLNRMILELF